MNEINVFDKNVFQKIEDLRNISDKIVFIGKESTVKKDIIDLVSYAKKLEFKEIWIETMSGMFVYKDFTDKIVDAGLTRVVFDFYAPDKKNFERISEIKGSFIKSVVSIRNLSKNNVVIHIRVPVNENNYSDLKNLVMFLSCNFVGINQYHLYLDSDKINHKELRKHLNELLFFCYNTNKDISLEGFPLCLIEGYENYSTNARRKLFDQRLVETRNMINNYYKKQECSDCSLRNLCDGIPKKFDIDVKQSDNETVAIEKKINEYYNKLDFFIEKYR